MGNPYLMDASVLEVDGTPITSGVAVKPAGTANDVTTKATWSKPKVKIPGSTDYSFTIDGNDEDDHALFLFLVNKARAKVPVPINWYPRGNAAGRLRISGTGYVSEPQLDGGVDKDATFQFQVNFTTVTTYSPNLVLAGASVGSLGAAQLTDVAAGAAYSGANLVATGGTSTYTYALVGAGAEFPVEGLSMSSGGVISGTANADVPQGTIFFLVRVTDSATPANTKDFLCAIKIT